MALRSKIVTSPRSVCIAFDGLRRYGVTVPTDPPLLEVRNLRKHFSTSRGLMGRRTRTVKAVDGVTFSVHGAETLALVGESGSGKTTTGRCVVRAVEPTSGSILFNAGGATSDLRGVQEIVSLDRRGLKALSKDMSMIFQDPYSSLDPRMSILDIVGEPLVIHRALANRRERERRVARLLAMVGLDPRYMQRYPHAFSGGQRQRIAIARALSMEPRFVIADEPVSALDVSVQAQILNLLKRLQGELELTFLFIAHDLSVVEYISDRIAVMYVGKIVELAETNELLRTPRHPYTESLLASVPQPDPSQRAADGVGIVSGEIPDPANPPSGCSFHPRCPYAQEVCRQDEPPVVELAGAGGVPRLSACHFARELSLAGIQTNAAAPEVPAPEP